MAATASAGCARTRRRKSHAELDEAEELDEGDPAALGADYAELRPRLRNVRVLGGCCGTDVAPRRRGRRGLGGVAPNINTRIECGLGWARAASRPRAPLMRVFAEDGVCDRPSAPAIARPAARWCA